MMKIADGLYGVTMRGSDAGGPLLADTSRRATGAQRVPFLWFENKQAQARLENGATFEGELGEDARD